MTNTSAQRQATPLALARQLALPSRQEMLAREPAVQLFWRRNKYLLADAWQEWESNNNSPSVLDGSILDQSLREAVTQAWQDPASEAAVEKLWQEVSPGVFQTQFFDPQQLIKLRQYLDAAVDSNIPLRPPYGIVLNRYGAMLDPRSEGYLAAPKFQDFYQQLIDQYMRPVARLLFPEIIGYDTQSFGFSIKWQAGMDTSLRLHTDASSVTLNINMNLPGEEFTGSEIDFYDPNTGKLKRLSFAPGTAMIHRGHVAHAALPITSGERSNMVLWLYGNGMQTPAPGITAKSIDSRQRWTIPTTPKDQIAPF